MHKLNLHFFLNPFVHAVLVSEQRRSVGEVLFEAYQRVLECGYSLNNVEHGRTSAVKNYISKDFQGSM